MDIKELRKSKKLTQAAFADAIGVPTSAVTAIETGRRKIGEELLTKVKEVFGENIDSELKIADKKPAAEKRSSKKTSKRELARRGIVIQSPMGGEITPDEILAKISMATKGSRIGKVDSVYVRVDENKAYWVKGKKTGAVDLW